MQPTVVVSLIYGFTQHDESAVEILLHGRGALEIVDIVVADDGRPVGCHDSSRERVGLAQIISREPEDQIALRLVDMGKPSLCIDGVALPVLGVEPGIGRPVDGGAVNPVVELPRETRDDPRAPVMHPVSLRAVNVVVVDRAQDHAGIEYPTAPTYYPGLGSARDRHIDVRRVGYACEHPPRPGKAAA